MPPSSIQHSYAARATAYTATLTVTDDNGASNTDTASVTSTANQAPIAQLSRTPASGKAPLVVTFNGSSSHDNDGSIASWSLDYGDGNSTGTTSGMPPSSIQHSDSAPATSHTPTLTVTCNNSTSNTDTASVTSTAYTPTRTVTDASGASISATASAPSTANPPPLPDALPTSASGKAPLVVTFNGSSSHDNDGSIASWSLDYGDGNSTGTTSGMPP